MWRNVVVRILGLLLVVGVAVPLAGCEDDSLCWWAEEGTEYYKDNCGDAAKRASNDQPVKPGTGAKPANAPQWLKAVDMDVARLAYKTARNAPLNVGHDSKIMLALFEAALVESGCNNLTGGADDSAGFLQQRPSQGWGTYDQVRDVARATRKFVEEARRVDKAWYSAGQLAQEVQVSAYPKKYPKRKEDAQTLLKLLKPV